MQLQSHNISHEHITFHHIQSLVHVSSPIWARNRLTYGDDESCSGNKEEVAKIRQWTLLEPVNCHLKFRCNIRLVKLFVYFPFRKALFFCCLNVTVADPSVCEVFGVFFPQSGREIVRSIAFSCPFVCLFIDDIQFENR